MVNFASLTTFRQTIADVDLSNYINFFLYFYIFMGDYQCPVDLAVQLAQVCSVMLNVLFEQNKMYVLSLIHI